MRRGVLNPEHLDLDAFQVGSDTDENGGKLPTRFVPVSDPHPVVALADLENEDVDIAGGTATFEISGEVTDAIADIIPNNLADIATVRVLVDGEEFIAPTALEAGDGGDASFWRRHPFKGLFEDLEVEVAADGSHLVTVETSANAAGNKGEGGILLSFLSDEEDFFGGATFVANIHIATNLTNTVADTIQYYHGDGEPYEEDPWLAETAAASLVFTGRLDGVCIEIDISGFGGLTTNVDTFAAEMRYNISTNYQPVYSNTFVETSATSGLFRIASAIAVGRGDLRVEVTPLGGTLPGAFVPVVERIKGPADLLGGGDCVLEFMGGTFELEAEDGWFYPKGGSPRNTVVVPDPNDPSAGRIITFERAAGAIALYGVPDWKLESMLDWQSKSLFDVKVRVIRIESVELVGAPSDGLVVKTGDEVAIKVNIFPFTYVPPDNEPKWYYQRLKSDGSWEAWASFGPPAYGKTYTHTTTMSGVFRVKTVLSVNGSVLCEKVYERKADEAYGREKTGMPDAFGVADTDYQITLRNSAKNWVGNTSYSVATNVAPWMGFPGRRAKSNKCNLFVAHRAYESGAVVPLLGGSHGIDPPSANQWAGQDDTHVPFPLFKQTDIGDWTLLVNPYPQPGFIVAHPSGISIDPGHVGIVDYNGKGIAAGAKEVNKIYDFIDGKSGFRKYEP